jgi:putative ABC transport system permease protein
MIEILRNMWRRKFRTILTIFGIVIGIFAFTVMGSMALKLNKMIDGGKKYITGQITITPKGTDFMTGASSSMLPVDLLNEIKGVEGVEAVEGSVSVSLDEPDPDNPTGGATFGPVKSIYSFDPSSNFKNKNWETMAMKEGKLIDKDSAENDISIGINVALDKGWKVGDIAKIRGREFKVVGIFEKTMTGPDEYVFMNLKIAREMFVDANPFLKSLKEKSDEAAKISQNELAMLPTATREQITSAKSFKIEDVSSAASISWKDGVDPEEVVTRIKNQFKDEVVVLSPKKMGEQIDKASATMNAIILGSALLALIVGLFSIINTMLMSVSERTKEIGIKKAIGASPTAIAIEYTLEAGIMGLLGGAIGMGLGVLAAAVINNKMASKGAEIFLIEPNFLIGVIAFSFAVGILAGLFPAIRASKLNVVDAIREL